MNTQQEQPGAEQPGDAVEEAITERSLTRLISLVTTLSDAYPVGLTREQIVERIPEYREGSAAPAALRQRFSRDKRDLRTLGIPLRPAPRRAADPANLSTAESGHTESFGEHDYRYVVDPTDFAHREIRLTGEEVLALHRATQLWAGTDLYDVAAQALDGIAELYERRGERLEMADPQHHRSPVSVFGLGDHRDFTHLSTIAEAGAGRAVTFDYVKHGAAEPETRRGIVLGCGRRSRWYLVVHDLDRNQPRTYRLDRISSESISPIGETSLSDAERTIARAVEDGRRHADFDVDAYLGSGPDRRPEQGFEEGAEQSAGPMVVTVDAWAAETLRPFAQTWTVSEATGVVRCELDRDLDEDLVGEIAAVAGGLRRLEGEASALKLREHLNAVIAAAEAAPHPAPTLRPVQRRVPREKSNLARLRRVLDIVAHLHSRGGATRDQLCEHFGLTPEQLHAELWHIQISASWSGGQDTYIEIDPFVPHDLEEYRETIGPQTVISVEVPLSRQDVRDELISRPLLLTRPGALSLKLALNGLIASAERYGRVLAEAAKSLRTKIGAVLPEGLDGTDESLSVDRLSMDWSSVDWDSADRHGRRDDVLIAVRAGYALRMVYRSAGGNAGERTVEPVELVYNAENAYLRAWCRQRKGERYFRLDRITELEPLPDSPVSRQALDLAASGGGPPQIPAGGIETVLHFAPPAAGTADRYGPSKHKVHPSGARTIATPMRSAELVVELCLRSGGDIAIIEPETLRAEVIRRARAGLDAVDGNGAGSGHGRAHGERV